MSETKTKAKRLTWRRQPTYERDSRYALDVRGYDLWQGDTRLAQVRRSKKLRTFGFFSRGTGRNTFLAGERFTSMHDARRAAIEWVRGEIAAGRPV